MIIVERLQPDHSSPASCHIATTSHHSHITNLSLSSRIIFKMIISYWSQNKQKFWWHNNTGYVLHLREPSFYKNCTFCYKYYTPTVFLCLHLYFYPWKNHIFHCWLWNLYQEIKVGWPLQLACSQFLVVSRHNLNISRFDLDHNLPNICFKYNRPNLKHRIFKKCDLMTIAGW